MDTNSSVPKEQFDENTSSIENTNTEEQSETLPSVNETNQDADTDSSKEGAVNSAIENKPDTGVADDNETSSSEDENHAEATDSTIEHKGEKEQIEKTEPKKSEKKEKKASKEKMKEGQDEPKEVEKDIPKIWEKSISEYSFCKKEELVIILQALLDNKSVNDIRAEVDAIKINFYKKHKAEIEKKKRAFIDAGGELLDFKPESDPLENDLKELLKRYKDLKSQFNSNLEVEKLENLKRKYEIIEEIKNLVNRKESINKTFHEFRELQNQWRDIGIVPQQNVKDLWETYHLHVAKFYDYIKINKELRDLDLKRNLEEKNILCEKAEALLLEPSVIQAFNALQKLHNQWREIGPVPNEMKDQIWERFKEATSKINKKHQEHFDHQKEEQKKNLEAKTLLCEKAEDIANAEMSSHKDWESKSRELIELQKIWRTIGFAPKKDNNQIYKRFRDACDAFFTRKREFYAENKELQDNNIQLKTDLCIQAEALKDSTEWKKTTEDFIKLQKQWKKIGPIPKKQSDHLWKRFRSACDQFFNAKAKFHENIDAVYEENMKKKEDLIKEIEEYKIDNNNIESCFEALNEFQKKWSEIGYVPLKEKDQIHEKYRKALNKKFEKLDVDEHKKNILSYKSKLDDITHKPKSDRRLKQERDGFISKIKKLESDIVLWENNIGFFIKSKNADAMIKEVEEKIADAKEKIALLEEKIKLIENTYDD
ncbi:MAG: DUF349 domain-containing protein [Bacteroidales bacterium]|nr:DUF349 domain-containing protein [Bacteroidales bacterium]